MTIAVAKCIGTLAPTIQHGLLNGVNEYVLLMGALCFVWDIIYIALLARGKSAQERTSAVSAA